MKKGRQAVNVHVHEQLMMCAIPLMKSSGHNLSVHLSFFFQINGDLFPDLNCATAVLLCMEPAVVFEEKAV